MPTDDPIPVTPLAEAAEPVEPQSPEPSPQPEAQAPEAAPPTAEPVEGDSQETPKPEAQPKAETPKPEKSHREKLIDQLTGVEEPKSEDDDEEPTPPAPQDKAPAKPEDTPKDKLDEPQPEDLNELTNDTAKAMKPGEVRRKINRLIQRVKEAAPLSAIGKEIIETCEANGFAPDDYKAWVNIGIGLQRGDPQAIEMFKGVAEKVGVTAAPAAPAITPEVEAWLDAQVKDLEISATAAAELRKRLGTAPKAATPPPAPAPRQPVAPPQPPAPRVDPVRVKAEQDLGKIADEYEAKLGKDRFAELEPRIMAGLKARKGAHPAAWPDIMRSVIEIELAKLPKPAAIQTNLRPGGQSGSSTPVFKTERERTIHRITNG